MTEAKKIRVKVKRRKLKLKNIFLALLIVILFSGLVYLFINIKIKNIYVIDNKIVSDKEIIYASKLNDYPPLLKISKKKIKNSVISNIPYIKDITIRKCPFKVYIYVIEHKVIALYNDKVLLDNGSLVDNTYDLRDYPILISDISIVKDNFIYYFNKVDNDIITKISQIEYVPNDVDKERFLLYMNDGNSVYITLTKIDKLNKYIKIISALEGKNGIIYLDSGDYIELK